MSVPVLPELRLSFHTTMKPGGPPATAGSDFEFCARSMLMANPSVSNTIPVLNTRAPKISSPPSRPSLQATRNVVPNAATDGLFWESDVVQMARPNRSRIAPALDTRVP